MPAFFSLNLTPSVTRDNISIEQGSATLDVQYKVTKNFDIQAVANANIDAFASKTTSTDLVAFDDISLSCDAIATKRLVQFLPAVTDVIPDISVFRTASSNLISLSEIDFLGGRLIDNVVNARYSNVGYVLEGYASDEPAAKTFATLRAESDITIILDVFVVSTLQSLPRARFSPTIGLQTTSTLSCSVTGVALIEAQCFDNVSINVDYNRYRDNEIVCDTTTNLTANADFTADGIQLVVSEATIEANVAKILGGIIVGDLPAAFTLDCIGDDLLLEETQVFVEVQSSLFALPGNRYFGEANLEASSGTVSVYTVEHLDIVYKIPAEGWLYKIEAEGRDFVINPESRIRKVASESRVKTIYGESRVNIIRR